MRISNNQFFGAFLRNDEIRQKKLERYSSQISSGKRILKPSDDTVALANSLKLKETNSQIDQYLRNITTVSARQQTAETALSNIFETTQEARVEIVRLLNHGVLDQEDADIVADYLGGLKQYIVDQANTKLDNVYLFGGTKSSTAPFSSDGTYQGNEKVETIPVSTGYELQGTFNGKEAFGAVGGKLKVVEVLDQIINAINSGDLTNVTENMLQEFDQGMEAISKYRSFIGAQAANLDEIRLQHETKKTFFNEMISDLEDANIADSITKMEQAKMAYEASMAVFNQNKELSLLKYFQ